MNNIKQQRSIVAIAVAFSLIGLLLGGSFAGAAPLAQTCSSGYAIWANTLTLDISGSTNQIQGQTRSNADIQLSGSNNIFTGLVEYVTNLNISGGGNVFLGGTAQVAASAAPLSFNITDYAPGGSKAVAAGANYHFVNGNYTFTAADIALGGLWYINGDAFLSNSNLISPAMGITIVATGLIDVSGSTTTLTPYVDGLLLFSNKLDSSSSPVIKIAGSNHNWRGHIYAPRGMVEFSGSVSTFRGTVIGDRVRLNGSNLTFIFDGSLCPQPTNTSTNTATNTATNTPTNTPIPPSNTPTDTPTNTPVPPTDTATDTPTNTPVPPTDTATDTPTNTPVPPTDTATNTPTRTNTPTKSPTPQADMGHLKVCKVAGAGVPAGTIFTITVNGTPYNVPAGKDSGLCVLIGQFPLNTEVTVQETIPAGYFVARIQVRPDGRVVSKNVTQGTVVVEIGTGVTEVIFTNRADGIPTATPNPTRTPGAPTATTAPPTGRLQICKEADGAGVTGDFTFTFAGKTRTIPVGTCTSLIVVPVGSLTINEVAKAGYVVSDIYTIPADRLISEDLAARSATVTIVQGNASTQTIVIFRNRAQTTQTSTDIAMNIKIYVGI